jgi:hypothetical protein
MNTGIHIGNTKQSIEKHVEILLQLVNSPAADAVKVAAITALAQCMKIENLSFSGVNIHNDITHNHYPDDSVEHDNLPDEED